MAILDNRFSINGVISTDKTVLQNLEMLCSAAGTWLTYDINDGLWSFVINQAGTSVKSFDYTNMIGAIQVSGSGLTELYNSVRVEFPHVDLNDNVDYVSVTIPAEDRFPNEPDNQLNIQFDIINNPVQAEILGLLELKQSRVDTIVSFVTDYSSLGLKAGDLIDISSGIHGWDQKMFRVVSIAEAEGDQGSINLNITALEYDSNVYDFTDLTRYIRENATGIQTIGAIGVPGTPTVNKVETTSRPKIAVESTAPTGIVEGLELWYTTDVPPAVTFDENRNYRLLQTVKPVTGNVFAYGEQVDFDVDNIDAGNFLVKTRGVNASTAGPFSDPSGVVYYAPKQTTDAVGPDTQVTDSAGDSITGLLTANALLAVLNGLYQNDDQSSGSLFESIFNNFSSAGAPIGGVTVSQAAAAQGLSINNIGTGSYEIDFGGKQVSINASDVVITWGFPDGSDLDIRCRIVDPPVGQNNLDDCLGYTGSGGGSSQFPALSQRYWPTSGTPYLEWGGDNTGSGSGATETVRVDIDVFRSYYPSATRLVVECRGNWYVQPGSRPVQLSAVLYSGGTTSLSGFNFVNSGATKTRYLDGVQVYVDSFFGSGTGNPGATAQGDVMGYFVYDLINEYGQFVNTLY